MKLIDVEGSALFLHGFGSAKPSDPRSNLLISGAGTLPTLMFRNAGTLMAQILTAAANSRMYLDALGGFAFRTAIHDDAFGAMTLERTGSVVKLALKGGAAELQFQNSGGVTQQYVWLNNTNHLGIGAGNTNNSMTINSSGNLCIGGFTFDQKLNVIGNAYISGNVGIGTTTPASPLTVVSPSGGQSAAARLERGGTSNYWNLTLDNNNFGFAYNTTSPGNEKMVITNAGNVFVTSSLALRGSADTFGTFALSFANGATFNNSATVYGIKGEAYNSGSGSVVGLNIGAGSSYGGTVPELYAGYFGNRTLNSSTIVTSAYSIYAASPSLGSGGAITTAFGLRIANHKPTAAVSESYGIYQEGADDRNYFAGKLGLGTTSPEARLHIEKDTTSLTDEQGYALKIEDGTNDVGLVIGVSATANYSIIQSFDPGTTWGGRPLVLMPNGGNLILGSAALATNATDGFFYIPTMNGAPTGTPTAFSGRVPMVYDSVNNHFYMYNGAWKKVALT